jgi:hypothetical protein
MATKACTDLMGADVAAAAAIAPPAASATAGIHLLIEKPTGLSR